VVSSKGGKLKGGAEKIILKNWVLWVGDRGGGPTSQEDEKKNPATRGGGLKLTRETSLSARGRRTHYIYNTW